MDPRKPLILVDVDGVLNPYAADVCPEGYREYHFFPDQEPVRCEARSRKRDWAPP